MATKKKDSKAGMEYEDMPMKTSKGLGKKYLVSEAKQLRITTLQAIVIAKVASATGRLVATVTKFIARLTWRFTKKHKFAIVAIWAVGSTVLQALPFLPELVFSTLMGVIS